MSKGVQGILNAYAHLRTLISLQARRNLEAGARSMADVLRTQSMGDVLRALLLSLTTDNPGGQPRTDEAKRQLLFFCNSLRNRWMPNSQTVRHNLSPRTPPPRTPPPSEPTPSDPPPWTHLSRMCVAHTVPARSQ
jgi:hypothetical protein